MRERGQYCGAHRGGRAAGARAGGAPPSGGRLPMPSRRGEPRRGGGSGPASQVQRRCCHVGSTTEAGYCGRYYHVDGYCGRYCGWVLPGGTDTHHTVLLDHLQRQLLLGHKHLEGGTGGGWVGWKGQVRSRILSSAAQHSAAGAVQRRNSTAQAGIEPAPPHSHTRTHSHIQPRPPSPCLPPARSSPQSAVCGR